MVYNFITLAANYTFRPLLYTWIHRQYTHRVPFPLQSGKNTPKIHHPCNWCLVMVPLLCNLEKKIDGTGSHPDLWQYRKACLCTSTSMCTSMTSLLPSQTTWPSFSQKPPSIPLCIYVMSTISPMYPLLICYIVPWCQDTSQIPKQFSSSDEITIPENYFKIR